MASLSNGLCPHPTDLESSPSSDLPHCCCLAVSTCLNSPARTPNHTQRAILSSWGVPPPQELPEGKGQLGPCVSHGASTRLQRCLLGSCRDQSGSSESGVPCSPCSIQPLQKNHPHQPTRATIVQFGPLSLMLQDPESERSLNDHS